MSLSKQEQANIVVLSGDVYKEPDERGQVGGWRTLDGQDSGDKPSGLKAEGYQNESGDTILAPHSLRRSA